MQSHKCVVAVRFEEEKDLVEKILQGLQQLYPDFDFESKYLGLDPIAETCEILNSYDKILLLNGCRFGHTEASVKNNVPSYKFMLLCVIDGEKDCDFESVRKRNKAITKIENVGFLFVDQIGNKKDDSVLAFLNQKPFSMLQRIKKLYEVDILKLLDIFST